MAQVKAQLKARLKAQSDQLDWSRPEWLEGVERWIRTQLDRRSIRPSGPFEQNHLRAWGTVLRAPAETGDFYFKANAPVLAFEAALTEALFRWQPHCTPEVLAVDAERGWLLMADGGATVREAFAERKDVRVWREILPRYAGLQKELAGRVDTLLSMGVPDHRLVRLPALYRAMLDDRRWLLVDQPGGISSAELQRLQKYAPRVAELCGRLRSYAIPPSLHHNDLHDGNIFFQDGRYVFFDWGDSSISHPFFSLRTVFVSIENSFGLTENDPIFDELVATYLVSWSDYGSAEDLLAAFGLAGRLWSLSSALKYWRFLNQVAGMADEYGDAVPSLMQEFLEANPAA
jgi:aminoglycoside/choline kinase family phosphotransferase